MTLELLCILFLSSPLLWELYDDRNGDNHGKKNDDWKLRGLLMLVSSVVVMLINPNRNVLQAFILSFGIFTLFFPYLVNILHLVRGVTTDKKWWNHLSKTAKPDKWEFWRGLHWSYRLIIMLIIFSACVSVYMYWCKIFSYYNQC